MTVLVEGNTVSPSGIIFNFSHFEMLPFMKYHCDVMFQLCEIQHEKFCTEKSHWLPEGERSLCTVKRDPILSVFWFHLDLEMGLFNF